MENTELLDAYEGEAEGKTIRWIIPDAEPYTSGSVSFASSLAADCGGDVRLNAVVKVGNREFSESKIVPILKPNHLTVFNELTGSGQKLHQTETGGLSSGCGMSGEGSWPEAIGTRAAGAVCCEAAMPLSLPETNISPLTRPITKTAATK